MGAPSGVITRIKHPKPFFDSNPKILEEICIVVNSGFGRTLEFDDIYKHVTAPKEVYLLRDERREKLIAMASYNKEVFSGTPSLIVEGISVIPEMQGKGVFKEITDRACIDEEIICLRTQNPHMYRALEKRCYAVFPGYTRMPYEIIKLRRDFAEYLGCKIDDKGVVGEYYGGLFYGKEPSHKRLSNFFKESLEMDLCKGDAVLVVGVVSISNKIASRFDCGIGSIGIW